MSREGYWNLRITRTLRHQLDSVAHALGDDKMDDRSVLAFALAWTIVSLPQYEKDEADTMLDAVRGGLEGLRVSEDNVKVYHNVVRGRRT